MGRGLIHPRFLAATAGTRGRGGITWTRARASAGDGVTAAVTTATGTITAYAWKAADLQDRFGLAQTQLSETGWYVSGAADLNLLPGDVLTSASEPAFVLLVQGPAVDALPGLTLWLAEQRG